MVASAIRVNAKDFLQIPAESIQSDIKNVSSLEHKETILTPDVGNFHCVESPPFPVGSFERKLSGRKELKTKIKHYYD